MSKRIIIFEEVSRLPRHYLQLRYRLLQRRQVWEDKYDNVDGGPAICGAWKVLGRWTRRRTVAVPYYSWPVVIPVISTPATKTVIVAWQHPRPPDRTAVQLADVKCMPYVRASRDVNASATELTSSDSIYLLMRRRQLVKLFGYREKKEQIPRSLSGIFFIDQSHVLHRPRFEATLNTSLVTSVEIYSVLPSMTSFRRRIRKDFRWELSLS